MRRPDAASRAHRPSVPTPILYRLSVVAIGLWALLATSTLVWVVAGGGWSAARSLAGSPGRLFAFEALFAWVGGAIGALAIFLTAFVLCQAVGRGLLRLLAPRPLAWPASIRAPPVPVRLLAFESDRAEAFTFALLRRVSGWRWRREEVIMVSDALLGALSPDEWTGVVAHELGHVRELDGRYLTFLRTFARLFRWDPLIAVVAFEFARREEFRADEDAVALTRRPRALARALYKASRLAEPGRLGTAALLGTGGRRGRVQTAERIRRLVALADSGEYADE